MSVDATHAFFLAWLHETASVVRFRRIDLHFDIPFAVLGEISVWSGKVQCLFIMHETAYPDGKLMLTVTIPEREEGPDVTFTCSASKQDLLHARAFLFDFSHQISTPQEQDLPPVVIADLTNVTVFPRQQLGPWYRRFQNNFELNAPSTDDGKTSDRVERVNDMLRLLPDFTPKRYQAAILPFATPESAQPSKANQRHWFDKIFSAYQRSKLSDTTMRISGGIFCIGMLVWLVVSNYIATQAREEILSKVRLAYPGLNASFQHNECKFQIAESFNLSTCHHQMLKDAFAKDRATMALAYLEQVGAELAKRGYDD